MNVWSEPAASIFRVPYKKQTNKQTKAITSQKTTVLKKKKSLDYSVLFFYGDELANKFVAELVFFAFEENTVSVEIICNLLLTHGSVRISVRVVRAGTTCQQGNEYVNVKIAVQGWANFLSWGAVGAMSK
jgi:hypothetical protein